MGELRDSARAESGCEGEPREAAWLLVFAGWFLASTVIAVPSARLSARDVQRRSPADLTRKDAALDVDGMSPRQLRCLPAIGQTRALAIARARYERGPSGLDTFVHVPGIGATTVGSIRAWLAARSAEVHEPR